MSATGPWASSPPLTWKQSREETDSNILRSAYLCVVFPFLIDFVVVFRVDEIFYL